MSLHKVISDLKLLSIKTIKSTASFFQSGSFYKSLNKILYHKKSRRYATPVHRYSYYTIPKITSKHPTELEI